MIASRSFHCPLVTFGALAARSGMRAQSGRRFASGAHGTAVKGGAVPKKGPRPARHIPWVLPEQWTRMLID